VALWDILSPVHSNKECFSMSQANKIESLALPLRHELEVAWQPDGMSSTTKQACFRLYPEVVKVVSLINQSCRSGSI
jgi:hypothetical protein